MALICVATLCYWSVKNRPIEEQAFLGQINGFAYAPTRLEQSAASTRYPTEEEIRADLALIGRHSKSIRTYSLDGTLRSIPRLAAEHGLDVTVGVWLDDDLTANRARLAEFQRIAVENPNVRRAIIGNETLLTGRLTTEQLLEYLQMLRELLDIEISTAEPWHIWQQNPALARAVDFMTVHLLPYWEGVPAIQATELIDQRMAALSSANPGLPIIIGEVGWPSHGRSRGGAVASLQDAERFLRRFLASAETAGYQYFLMEAFDQPWKSADEGEVGAHWGLFDAGRDTKYVLAADKIEVAGWRWRAALAAAIAAVVFLLLTVDSRRMRWPGLLLSAGIVLIVVNAAVWNIHAYLHQYWTLPGLATAMIMLTGIAGIIVLILVEAHEWAETQFISPARLAGGAPAAKQRDWPKVSIHVPTYAEPPAMLIETLNRLASVDYPNYEVLVIDNNTEDETLWRSVEEHCRQLGSRFRFFHVSPLRGYKAGALNFALRKAASDATIIGVVDSDYAVEPMWLKALVHHFDEPKVAIVQAPQDYRDQASHGFKRYCEAEYRGFFKLGMITRNERNAIIQHGTMTLIRASALRQVGGWAEWTVTEDAELGLRIFESGYEAVYTPVSYGEGLHRIDSSITAPNDFGGPSAQHRF